MQQNYIEQIVEAQQRFDQAERCLHTLTTPRLVDLSAMENAVARVRAAVPDKVRDSGGQKQLLMALLSLFAPATLAGDIMRSDLKRHIARTLGITVRRVEYLAKDLHFHYTHYKDFKDGVDGMGTLMEDFCAPIPRCHK